MRVIVRAGLVLVLGLGLAGVAAGQEELSKRDAGGPVAVTVTLLERPVVGASIKAKVGLDTHSVGLDGIKFEEAVAVRTVDGAELPPASVEQATGGGHHREAVLTFPALGQSGALTIVVKNVGGIAERTFSWAVPPAR
jgi:hypothetical protein